MKNKKHIIFRFLREIGDEGVFHTVSAYPASKKEAMRIVDAAAKAVDLFHLADGFEVYEVADGTWSWIKRMWFNRNSEDEDEW